ncbi:MAG: DUF5330 domain-containing protein [Rhodomicrobium sp.]
MMFLLRFAFWILVICLLLQPADNQRLLSSAERTVHDVRGFCERNPEVCDDASVIMTSMLTKLKSGAELMQYWLAQNGSKGRAGGTVTEETAPANGQPAAKSAGEPLRAAPEWEDSLNPSDKEMPWHGPARL